MILSRRTASSGLFVAGPASTSTSTRTSSTHSKRSRSDKGKDKVAVRGPWADGPWPLIEAPSRTQTISHAAQHIANEVSHAHNAMLRGLNALYLQAPFIQASADVADFCFLARVWAIWVRDYHVLKEGVMVPGFENVLGLERGRLGMTLKGDDRGIKGEEVIDVRSGHAEAEGDDEEEGGETGKGKGKGKEKEDMSANDIPTLLKTVIDYASATHSDPSTYSPSTLQNLLISLANTLVPHLHTQISVLLSMQELCFELTPSSSPTSRSFQHLTLSSNSPPSSGLSPPSPALSSSSSSSLHRPAVPQPKSQTAASPPTPASTPPPVLSTPPAQTLPTPPPTTTTKAQAKAQAKLEALVSARAARLTQTYLAAEAAFSRAADPYTLLPLIVRLRDAAGARYERSRNHSSHRRRGGTGADSPGSANSSSGGSNSNSNSNSAGARGSRYAAGVAETWPRLSVAAVHAVADRLSPRHAGAWRFLPSDVWGRRRELVGAGVGERDRVGGEEGWGEGEGETVEEK